MKDKILELRSLGFTYRAIEAQLGCSKSTISFHCGEGQKEKNACRSRERRKRNPELSSLKRGTFNFNQLRGFRDLENRTEYSLTMLQADEVLQEQQGKCYLTGRNLDFSNKGNIHFDHKIPVSKGGSSTKENLGICIRQANLAKSDMTVQEFLDFCKEVLEYHNYTVISNC
jgi:5-methylcytosine-specific restriction endonuclease McrA